MYDGMEKISNLKQLKQKDVLGTCTSQSKTMKSFRTIKANIQTIRQKTRGVQHNL